MSGLSRGRCPTPNGIIRLKNQDVLARSFPADYICEAIDQTRGWFLQFARPGDAVDRSG